MGIYMNRNNHPNLFLNRNQIEAPNQDYFQSDQMRERLEKQQQINESLENTLKSFRISLQKQQFASDKRWKDVADQVEHLSKSSKEHDDFVLQAREWLQVLDKNNHELQELMKQESIVKQDMEKEIGHIHESNKEIINQLASYDGMNEELTNKMNELVALYKSISEQMTEQNEKQDTVLKGIENQEAIMEKSYRQVSNLRSILFERTSFIADKIEESYKLTSSALYKFLTGSDKPLAFMLMNKKRDGKEQED